MVWNESKPAPPDLMVELPSVITANKLAFRRAIEKHSFWTDSSTNSIGVPRLSDGSAGPGSCRAFYDGASNISQPLFAAHPLAGRLYVTSDTTQLFAYIDFVGGGAGTAGVPMGSHNLVSYWPSYATIPQNCLTLVQSGQTVVGSNTTVPFPSTYSQTPTIQLTVLSDGTVNPANFGKVALVSSSTTNFVAQLTALFGSVSNFSVLWRSHGTVAI